MGAFENAEICLRRLRKRIDNTLASGEARGARKRAGPATGQETPRCHRRSNPPDVRDAREALPKQVSGRTVFQSTAPDARRGGFVLPVPGASPNPPNGGCIHESAASFYQSDRFRIPPAPGRCAVRGRGRPRASCRRIARGRTWPDRRKGTARVWGERAPKRITSGPLLRIPDIERLITEPGILCHFPWMLFPTVDPVLRFACIIPISHDAVPYCAG